MTHEEELSRAQQRIDLREKEEHFEMWFATEFLGRRSSYDPDSIWKNDELGV